MRACILRRRGRDGVAVEDLRRPEPGPGEALVRMLAASVNRVDLYMRDDGAGITHDLPQIMGVDGVGEVVSAPEGSGFAPGDRVALYPMAFCGTCPHCLAGDQPLCRSARILGEHRDGTLAEHVALPARSLLHAPPGADPAQTAALGVAYLTAWRMVFGKTRFRPGMTVLVQGAGGGVAHAAAQLAQMAGARVIAATSGAGKAAHFEARGIATVDRRNDPLAAIMALTGGEGADLVIDNVGAATWNVSMRAVRRGGAIVTCGAATGAQPGADLQRLFVRQISVHGSTLGGIEEFRDLLACFARGGFDVPLDSVFPLDRVAEALARLDAPDRLGKVAVEIAAPSMKGACA